MGVVLRSFEMPKVVEVDESSATDTYGKFTAEPFERGFGVTVGNSLRRVLLSSLEGAAVSSIRIEGADHEFASIPGVQEDVSEIVLNIKQLVLRAHSRDTKTISISVDKKGDVTAADIKADDTIDVVNPDLHIATLNKKMTFKAEMTISRGRGFVVADQNKSEELPVGFIPVDSIYSPVTRVSYKVEDTRVGQITDYDKLTMEVWTNGSVSPKDAVLHAANIMQQQISVFSNLGQIAEAELDEPSYEEAPAASSVSPDDDIQAKLQQPVSELELSVRSANCLSEARIKTIGELVSRSEAEMLKYRNFGKKSLTEIGEILNQMGLGFGMQLENSQQNPNQESTAL